MVYPLFPLQFVIAAIALWLNRQQQEVIDYLKEENRLLKDKLGERKLRYFDKRLRAELGKDPDPFKLSADLQEALRHTKCHEWSYEREQRLLIPISETVEDTVAGSCVAISAVR